MKFSILIFISFSFFNWSFLFANGKNQFETQEKKSSEKNQTNLVKEVQTTSSGTDWITFSKDREVSLRYLFEEDGLLKLNSEDDFTLQRVKKDRDTNFSHYTFLQTYKKVKVENGEYLVHEKNGKVVRANGIFVKGLNLDVVPSISANNAIKIAIQNVNAEKYRWESEFYENELKREKNDKNATNYPKAKLIIGCLNSNDILNPDKYILMYRIDISSLIPRNAQAIYVDALSGKVVKVLPLMSICF